MKGYKLKHFDTNKEHKMNDLIWCKSYLPTHDLNMEGYFKIVLKEN